ncbi:MAG: ferredoxin [Janthinobacterium lividum]
MKIKVDVANCAGHARCANVAPSLFNLTDDGYLATALIDVPDVDQALARRSVRACPERILTLIDGDEAP